MLLDCNFEIVLVVGELLSIFLKNIPILCIEICDSLDKKGVQIVLLMQIVLIFVRSLFVFVYCVRSFSIIEFIKRIVLFSQQNIDTIIPQKIVVSEVYIFQKLRYLSKKSANSIEQLTIQLLFDNKIKDITKFYFSSIVKCQNLIKIHIDIQ